MGNIYVVLDGTRIMRSTGGSQPFVLIGQSLNFLRTYINPSAAFINSLSADSRGLVAATLFGFFLSTDGGITWSEYNHAPATACYGLAQTPGGRLITSTDLGVFVRNATDTTWVRTLPQHGYLKAGRIFRVNDGTLFTTGGYTPSYQNTMIWKSIDDGQTWIADTLGSSAIRMDLFFVDESGTMHAASNGQGPSGVKLYVRSVGGAWVRDEDGFTSDSGSIVTCITSDKQGKIYVATNSQRSPKLQERSLAGGSAWRADTNGLQSVYVYDIAAQKNGTLVAGTYGVGAMVKPVGGAWQQLNYPPGTIGSSCFVVGVDGNDAVWTQWTSFNASFQAIGTGLFYTTDRGNSWTSKSIDTVTFRELVSTGDGVYGVSYVDGLFKFTHNGGSAVKEQQQNVPSTDVELFPNPATDVIHGRLTLPAGPCRVHISDVLGREVMVSEIADARSFDINVSSLGSGVFMLEFDSIQGTRIARFVKR